MSTCRQDKNENRERDWCVAHNRAVWECAAHYQHRADLLQQTLDATKRMQYLQEELLRNEIRIRAQGL